MQLRKQFYSKNHLNLIGYFICMITESLIVIGLAIVIRHITDLIAGADKSSFASVLIQSVLVVLLNFLIATGEYYFEARYLRKAVTSYRNSVFEKIFKKDRTLFKSEGSNTYLSALTNDITVITEGYLKGSVQIVSYSVLMISALCLMLYYSVILTIIALAFGAIPLVIAILTGNYLAIQEKNVSDANAGFIGKMNDFLTGFSVIKDFQAENEVQKLFGNDNASLEKTKFRRNILCGRISVLSSTGGFITQVGVFLVGAYLAVSGENITPGIVIAFISLLGNVINPITKIPTLIAARKSSGKLIDKIENELQKNIGEEKGTMLEKSPETIKLRNVSYEYSKDQPVLKNVNAEFGKGKAYAIVGASGSGKSTLLDLVFGSRENYTGNITLDGLEKKDISYDSMVPYISTIQQNVFVLEDSIINNITMYKQFPKDEVEKAVNMSGLRNLIDEKGYDYNCGSGGCNLSGGEKQRISIARSLLKHSSYLVADEITAALDNQTAYDVMNSLISIPDMTKIFITHQLNSKVLERFDSIFVIHDGRFIEQGKFEELMDKKQYFYMLYNTSLAET